MANVVPKQIIERHAELQDLAKEAQGIEATSIWQRLKAENEQSANAKIAEFAFGQLPDNPDKMLAWFLKLRSDVAKHLWIINEFNDIKERNLTELFNMIGETRATPNQEEVDLSAGNTY
jgi:hypothetical protein